MSGDVSDKKRLISVKSSNIRNNHIYISGHHDFFPDECYGPSNQAKGLGRLLTLRIEGFKEPEFTDIALDGSNGRPRNFFRNRSWAKKFFERFDIQEGDVLAVERLSKYEYRIYPFETKNIRDGFEIPLHWQDISAEGLTVIDLFAGCGGFSYGLKKAGFNNLLAVEWDHSCCETFKNNINSRILQCAIQEVETFPVCDILVGGPPCQGFSNLGERVPLDPRRQLWRHFLRAVKDAKPKMFVLENVPPILKSAEYEEIIKNAKCLGYEVEGRLLNSADYGVPQTRKRAFIIGSRIGTPVFPIPTHKKTDDTFFKSGLPDWKTVRDAISDLPPEPDGKNWHIGRNPTELSKKRYKCIPPGGNRWDLPLELMPECWKRKTKGGTDLFGRLWWDRPSVTIRTEFYKPEKGRYLHPEEDRPITHREAARLQGFDDNFVFCGKKIAVGIQIGNAVPPPLGFEIGKALKQQIEVSRLKCSI